MKNIHILPTEKLTKISISEKTNTMVYNKDKHDTLVGFVNQNIYITSDEEIKEGDYWIYICPISGLDYGDNGNPIVKNNLPNTWFNKLHDKLNYKNIILTTDQDLIKDGVQAIDDEFLEWFVKNPSCEEVEIEYQTVDITKKGEWIYNYKIIIPKEENFKHELHELSKEEVLANRSSAYEFIDFDKQETLEEAAEKWVFENNSQKWSNNDNTSGDNYGSFIAGAKWQQERMYSEMDIVLILSKFRDMKMIAFSEWFEKFRKK